ncbi:MAG TPA: transcription elongation factor GreB [Nevskiaceae bacterium]
MGRYRPPAPVSTPCITAQGFARLRAEYDHLWHERRPAVVKALAAAAAEGDRSENAEYIYRKKELREIDRRVGYLQRRIPRLKVVDGAPDDPQRVFFGAWVELVDDAETVHRYRIVGPDETDAGSGWISIDSPLARALLRHAAGEAVEVELPGGVHELEIRSVRYGDAADGAKGTA